MVEGEVSMNGRNQHITKRSDDNWQVESEGQVVLPLLRSLGTTLSHVLNKEATIWIWRKGRHPNVAERRSYDGFELVR